MKGLALVTLAVTAFLSNFLPHAQAAPLAFKTFDGSAKPSYGVNPDYHPDREAYPWEPPKQPGSGYAVGHQPLVRLVKPKCHPKPHHAVPEAPPGYGTQHPSGPSYNTKNPTIPIYGKQGPIKEGYDTQLPSQKPSFDTQPGYKTNHGTDYPHHHHGYGARRRQNRIPTRRCPNDHKPFNITIVTTNDLHAHMDQFNAGGTDCTEQDIRVRNCFGGIARIKSLVDRVRAENKHTYVMDAGDQFQGHLFYSYYKGNVTAEFVNALGYDVVTPGNHEWDDGSAHLGRYFRKLKMPVVCANIDTSDEPGLDGTIVPFTVLHKYGARIGVIGFITNTIADIAPTGKNKFWDPVPAVQKAVDELHAMGVTRIIAVSHNGYTDDQRVAAKTRGISLIVGGHSHTLLHKSASIPGVKGPFPTAVKNLDGQDTYIVQSKMFGQYVGVVQIAWDEHSQLISLDGTQVLMDDTIPQHPEWASTVAQWREPFDRFATEVIGHTSQELSKYECYQKSCALGQMVAEVSLQSYTKPLGPARAAVAIVNEGGLRASIPAGEVTVGHVLTALPFNSYIVDARVKGKFVREILENAASSTNVQTHKPVTSGIQIAGMRVTFDMAKPEGQRVTKLDAVAANGTLQAIEDGAEYVLVTMDYLAVGNDQVFPGQLMGYSTGSLDSDLVMDYIRRIGDIPATFHEDWMILQNGLLPKH